ncbi:MAG: response regulator, partial [Elusimicrobia bacterium]|nr:response regulator [Elusimicrobiota bacterium]
VLVVDDEEDLVEMLVLRLEAAGFTVERAYDGASGLQKVSAFKPQVLLLDSVMPGTLGLGRVPAAEAGPSNQGHTYRHHDRGVSRGLPGALQEDRGRGYHLQAI